MTGFAGKSRYIINEFTFDTDNNGRVIKAFGKLQSISGIRNPRNQMRAAAWGRSGDEGGHLIPAKYGGPGAFVKYSAASQKYQPERDQKN